MLKGKRLGDLNNGMQTHSQDYEVGTQGDWQAHRQIDIQDSSQWERLIERCMQPSTEKEKGRRLRDLVCVSKTDIAKR